MIQVLRGYPDLSEAELVQTMLVQIEIKRVKIVERSYIRTRLYSPIVASSSRHMALTLL
jgi:hypothetical protein